MKLFRNIYIRLSFFLTGAFRKVPLIYITFDYVRFLKKGADKSCDVNFIPDFTDDEKLMKMSQDIVDHIRSNYDMHAIALDISGRVKKKSRDKR